MAQQIKITQTSNADMNIGVPKNLTAVEWLIEKIAEDYPEIPQSYREEYQKAKAMEKKNIIDAYSFGCARVTPYGYYEDSAEQYYTETYQSNQDKPNN
jgi:hypothetical protein